MFQQAFLEYHLVAKQRQMETNQTVISPEQLSHISVCGQAHVQAKPGHVLLPVYFHVYVKVHMLFINQSCPYPLC